jgi:hypothetical protein
MDEVTIEVEADTLEEATRQLKSQIPAGLDILRTYAVEIWV